MGRAVAVFSSKPTAYLIIGHISETTDWIFLKCQTFKLKGQNLNLKLLEVKTTSNERQSQNIECGPHLNFKCEQRGDQTKIDYFLNEDDLQNIKIGISQPRVL
jgi:hypothetical protein